MGIEYVKNIEGKVIACIYTDANGTQTRTVINKHEDFVMTYDILRESINGMLNWDWENEDDEEAKQHAVDKETCERMLVCVDLLEATDAPCPNYDITGYGQAELYYPFGPTHEDDEDLFVEHFQKKDSN
jgi:hypothetical protein